MKQIRLLALFSLPVLCLAFAHGQSQVGTDSATLARGLTSLGPVYTGHSVDGNLQEALDLALQHAQQGVADSTGIADAVFEWNLVAIRGTRGGFVGLQDLSVDVAVR
ncbi:MAG: hypothetical protein IPJ19_08195 [Planctomycetes bacterium]|nr:hypothetical protein [Planctomycetota bacterium]